MSKRRKSAGAASRSSRTALPLILALFVVGAGLGIWYANRQSGSGGGAPTHVDISRIEPGDNEVKSRIEKVPIDPSKGDALKQALEAQIAPPLDGGPSAFPAGTKLIRVEVQAGIAILELSAEFSALNSKGSTGESLAFEALRSIFAQFPQVERMRVMVDGKVFEGEHSGLWADIQVREGRETVEDRP